VYSKRITPKTRIFVNLIMTVALIGAVTLILDESELDDVSVQVKLPFSIVSVGLVIYFSYKTHRWTINHVLRHGLQSEYNDFARFLIEHKIIFIRYILIGSVLALMIYLLLLNGELPGIDAPKLYGISAGVISLSLLGYDYFNDKMNKDKDNN
jgi:hypothetical protein